MVTETASARILSFPTTQQKPDLEANNLIRRIIDSKDSLLTALEVLRDSYNVILARTSLKDADEILAQAEAALQHAANVMANVEQTTRIIKNWQATSQKQLLLFPPSNRAGAVQAVEHMSGRLKTATSQTKQIYDNNR